MSYPAIPDEMVPLRMSYPAIPDEMVPFLARLVHAFGEVESNSTEHITSVFVADAVGEPDLGFRLEFERDATRRGTYLLLIEIQETE
jgi:hypothetical protein